MFLVRLFWLSLRVPGYRERWPERLGHIPDYSKNGGLIWIHAVSVGEVKAAVELIKALVKEFPGHRVVVSTVTPTGKTTLRKEFQEEICHFYFPYDIPGFMIRMLERLRPSVCIVMETEIWPNLYRLCKQKDIPIVIANARISPSSFRGYRRLSSLAREALESVSLVLAQTAGDAERYMTLGAPPGRVEVPGNLKFDLPVENNLKNPLKGDVQSFISSKIAWIAASTHDAEEEIVLEAQQHISSDIENSLVIIAPRHPQRFEKVAALCTRKGFRLQKLSGLGQGEGDSDPQVLLVDSIGELDQLFPLATLAFIGGSLVEAGGHNMIEPAAHGIPVITGPHYVNFLEIGNLMLEGGALKVVNNNHELASTVSALLRDSKARDEMGKCGRQILQQHSGATQKTVEHIKKVLQ